MIDQDILREEKMEKKKGPGSMGEGKKKPKWTSLLKQSTIVHCCRIYI